MNIFDALLGGIVGFLIGYFFKPIKASLITLQKGIQNQQGSPQMSQNADIRTINQVKREVSDGIVK